MAPVERVRDSRHVDRRVPYDYWGRPAQSSIRLPLACGSEEVQQTDRRADNGASL